MHIDDDALRKSLCELLKTRTRNQIVREIRQTSGKFHQFQIDNFLHGKDVTLSTLQKLDEYNYRHVN